MGVQKGDRLALLHERQGEAGEAATLAPARCPDDVDVFGELGDGQRHRHAKGRRPVGAERDGRFEMEEARQDREWHRTRGRGRMTIVPVAFPARSTGTERIAPHHAPSQTTAGEVHGLHHRARPVFHAVQAICSLPIEDNGGRGSGRGGFRPANPPTGRIPPERASGAQSRRDRSAAQTLDPSGPRRDARGRYGSCPVALFVRSDTDCALFRSYNFR